MKKECLSVLLFLVVLSSAFSQNKREREAIMEYYKSQEQILFDSERYPLNEKELAVERALKNNIPLSIVDKDGVSGELVRFDGDLPLYYRTYNDGSAITSRTNLLYAAAGLGYNLTGSNMLVGVWDQNHPRTTHFDFRFPTGENRILAVDGPTAVSAHSTHVTGTILSSGANSTINDSGVPRGRGMAYQAEGWIFDWSSDISEMDMYAGFGLLVSNHSYGLIAANLSAWYFGAYVSDSRSVDNVCFNWPKYLPVFAAGNDRNNYSLYNPSKNGNDLLTGKSVSKNPLMVGAVGEVADYTGPGSVVMSNFSNYGPTDDFRIKPDLVAKGVNVYSTVSSSDTDYGFLSGTSMAAPAVTGSLLLVQQYYGEPYLNASTLKGLAIHTADEAGSDPGPDHKFGWGLLNTYRMVETIDKEGVESLIKERTLGGVNGSEYHLDVLALGTESLKVTLCWTDRPGNAVSNGTTDSLTSRLINDLDVVVTKSDETYYPWRLNKDWNNIYALKGNNNVDPVERVDIDSPSGIYHIKVSHKGTSLQGGTQNYSLIITGIDADADLKVNSLETETELKVWHDKRLNALGYELAKGQTGVKEICLYDVNGRLVQQFNDVASNVLYLNSVEKGVYVLSLVDLDGKRFIKKIII